MPDKYSTSPAALVIGGGPAGLTAAIALAAGGIGTALVGRRPAKPDNRTTALLAGSVTALKNARRLGPVRSAGRATQDHAHCRRYRPAMARAGGEI